MEERKVGGWRRDGVGSGVGEWEEAQAKETVVLSDNAQALQHGPVPFATLNCSATDTGHTDSCI